MTAFARQLRGEASFKANPDGGLTAQLVFPLPESAEETGAERPGSERPGSERPGAVNPAAAR
jgi:hypothetical protein